MPKWIEITPSEAKEHPLYGIKNWLAVFLLAVLFNLGRDYSVISTLARELNTDVSTILGVRSVSTIAWFEWCLWIDAILVAIVYVMAYFKLRAFRVVSSIAIAISWPISFVIAISLDVPATDHGGFLAAIPPLGFAVIWISYLNVSKRVRVTFEHQVRANKEKPLTHSDVPPAAWEKALIEFESDNRQKGVWASFFAESQGNEQLAKSKYLARRAMEIHQTALPG